MSKRGIKPVCVFLIYLMIILPIYASVSYAQFYGNVHGIDRVAGFRRVTQDLTTINVTAKSARTPGELMSSRFVLLGNPAQRFTCKYNNLTEYTDCETTIVEERPAGEHLYEVQLFNPDMQTFEFGKLMLRLLVDSTPPQALSFNVIRDGDNVSATYIVADRLCPTCPTSICSGIKKVSFIHNLQKIGEANFNTPYCSVQNKTLLSIPPGTSQRRICLRAEDRLGQTSENCKDILIDFEPPKLVNASLWTSAGKIQYYDGKPLGNVRLELYFQEDSPLNVSTLFADLSKLNTRPEFAAVYSQILGSDQAAMNRFQIECSNETEGEGLWKCEINNILMFIPLGGANPTITFTIKDIRENRYSDTFEIPLIFDGAAPVLTKISTGIADDKGRYWVTSNTENTIYADIKEEGSGMSKRRIFLDFGSFGPQTWADGNTKLQANNCTQGWRCTFGGVTVNTDLVKIRTGDVVSVSKLIGSADDAGNPMAGVEFGAFYYDDQPPKIVDYTKPDSCPVFGDKIAMTITVEEPLSGGVKLEYDARGLSTSYFPQQAECEQDEKTELWSCKFVLEDFYTIYVDGKINITLSDLAGNKETTQIPFEVCESAPGVPPNLITCYGLDERVEPNPKPGNLDRKIATQIAMPLFIKPWCATSAEIDDVTMGACTVAEGGTVPKSYVLEKEDPLNPTIAASVQLDPAWASSTDEGEPPESVELTCELNFKVRTGRTVYKLPETENLTFDIPLEELPFGYVDDATVDTLDDLQETIEDLEDQIDNLKKVNYFFGVLCSIAELAVLLMTVLILVKNVFLLFTSIAHAAAMAKGDKPAAMKAVKGYYKFGCKILAYIMFVVIHYLWNAPGYIVTTVSSGTIIRIVCGMYTCKLADANKFARITPVGGMGLADTSSGSYTYSWQAPQEDEDEEDTGLRAGSTRMTMDEEGNLRTSGSLGAKPLGDSQRRTFFPEGDDGSDEAEDLESLSNYRSPGQAYIPFSMMFSEYDFDPYKSIHTALSTGCVPMIIYNQQKLRQLKCMQFKCIVDRAKSGFDTQVCHDRHAILKCLYYDSAAYKLAGTTSTAWNKGWMQYMWLWSAELPVMLLGWGVTWACYALYGEPDPKFKNAADATHTATSILLALLFPLALLMFIKNSPLVAKAAFFRGPINYDANAKPPADGVGPPAPTKNPHACINPEKSKAKDTTATLGYYWSGIGCDVLLLVLYGMDLGEWAWYKSSWDIKSRYFDGLEGTDYCEGIDDTMDQLTQQ